MDLSLPRGIRDIDPDEYTLHSRVQRAFEEVALSFNFRMMEPAPMEHLSVLRAKSGADIDNEIYTLVDKSGRELGLRFDLTVGMTRYVCGRKDMRPPVKLACFGGVWRYDEPQHARYRWFKQWDLEVFGPPAVEEDAEVIEASYRIFEKLGLPGVLIQVGDRKVVQEFIEKRLGAGEERVGELMRALDKVQKRSLTELKKEYVSKGFREEELGRLFEFGALRGPPSKVLSRLEELKLSAAGDLSSLVDQLSSRGVKNVEYNMSVVRGIDYYTGLVFEVLDSSHPELGALCGGGRYDMLPRILGRPDLSATGAAGGVERAVLSMAKQREAGSLVFVAFATKDVYHEALRTLSLLRGEGAMADISISSKSLGKQLEEAAAQGARWVLIVGKKELSSGLFTLRNMVDRSEERLPLKDVLERINSSL